jgi:hydroxymethylglutaryl-CoA lyase
MKKYIKITEVGPRDGLQNEKDIIATDQKFEFILSLLKSGLKNIEVTSFVRPDRIPQLSDSEELSILLKDYFPGRFSCLTPNKKGYEKAIQNGYKEVAVFTAASESFTSKNINSTIQQSIETFKEISILSKKDNVHLRAYISTIFYCPYEGKINPEKVLDTIDRLIELEPYEISLGDTIGKGVPEDSKNLLDLILKKYPPTLFAGHFHDTYGMAISNVNEFLRYGIKSFDSSIGGLGGCPYAPGASGNLATEDLVYYLENSGYDTGIDLNVLCKTTEFMEGIVKKKSSSKVYLALKQQ